MVPPAPVPVQRRWSGRGPALERPGRASSVTGKAAHPPEEDAMSATIRRTARSLVVLAAVPVTLALSVLPAQAMPDPGTPVAAQPVPVVECDPTADWPSYPGWRGPCLPPELRGH